MRWRHCARRPTPRQATKAIARNGDPQPYRLAAEQVAARVSAAVGEARAAWALLVEGYTELSERAEAQKILPLSNS